MKLTELSPRWLTPNYFVFRCPHCRVVWLACKNVVLSDEEQMQLLEAAFGESMLSQVIGARTDFAWQFEGGADFSTLTVTPSVDASRSGGGHWHGFIANGEIR